MRKNRNIISDKAEVDLTPMLDVVFILLIFFIVTASFVSEKSLAVNTPTDLPQTRSQNTSVLIQIYANNDIRFEGRKVDMRSVASLVAQKLAEDSERAFVVKAHELANTRTYMHVADAINKSQGKANLITWSDHKY